MAAADDLPVRPDLVIPGTELRVSVSRASGPGGQHVNTTDSRVQVRWNVPASAALDDEEKERLVRQLAARLTRDGDLVVACDTHRSQHRNREEARTRLAALVRAALHRPRPRRATGVPRAAKERRLEHKRLRAQVKRRRQPPDED